MEWRDLLCVWTWRRCELSGRRRKQKVRKCRGPFDAEGCDRCECGVGRCVRAECGSDSNVMSSMDGTPIELHFFYIYVIFLVGIEASWL